ncbi:MAG: hypothetical protein CEE38_10630 [Planctomycetes bacterium B3_Pla]|nr:MAG: hypothetical protein CEE38_10630 [Planctomycetes bacterium B3_Pla]
MNVGKQKNLVVFLAVVAALLAGTALLGSYTEILGDAPDSGAQVKACSASKTAAQPKTCSTSQTTAQAMTCTAGQDKASCGDKVDSAIHAQVFAAGETTKTCSEGSAAAKAGCSSETAAGCDKTAGAAKTCCGGEAPAGCCGKPATAGECSGAKAAVAGQ